MDTEIDTEMSSPDALSQEPPLLTTSTLIPNLLATRKIAPLGKKKRLPKQNNKRLLNPNPIPQNTTP